jgi:pyruvate dehydrogenase E2 component (dihydrolipoamide acetyltransferase)
VTVADASAATGSTWEYALPSLGADMDRGRVVEWRVAVGDRVERGDVVGVVETEKSDIDIEIWHPGVVDAFLVERGVEIDVGTPIMRLVGDRPDTSGSGDAPVTQAATQGPLDTEPPIDAEPRSGTEPPAEAEPALVPSVAGGSGRPAASPRARRLAAERGVDLTAVSGTGPGGAIVAADLDAAPVTEPAAPVAATAGALTEPADRMRAMIAARMSRSNREIPHYHLTLDVDLTALGDWIAEHNATVPITERLVPAAAYVKAIAVAAAQQGALNGTWVDDRFVPGDGVNVAMAVSLRRGGLLTPVVRDADRLSIGEIMAILRDHVAAARTGSLKASWMTGSTITVTNLGDRGADLVHGVISPPEVALVGIGSPRERAWVVDGEVAVRTVATFSLAADHRATDGITGSRFLRTVADVLEHPERLADADAPDPSDAPDHPDPSHEGARHG